MDIKELRNTAKFNKKNLMYSFIEIELDGVIYSFQIKGVGAKAIKLEAYFSYEDIANSNDKDIIEQELLDKINTVYKDSRIIQIGNKRVIN